MDHRGKDPDLPIKNCPLHALFFAAGRPRFPLSAHFSLGGKSQYLSEQIDNAVHFLAEHTRIRFLDRRSKDPDLLIKNLPATAFFTAGKPLFPLSAHFTLGGKSQYLSEQIYTAVHFLAEHTRIMSLDHRCKDPDLPITNRPLTALFSQPGDLDSRFRRTLLSAGKVNTYQNRSTTLSASLAPQPSIGIQSKVAFLFESCKLTIWRHHVANKQFKKNP